MRFKHSVSIFLYQASVTCGSKQFVEISLYRFLTPIILYYAIKGSTRVKNTKYKYTIKIQKQRTTKYLYT